MESIELFPKELDTFQIDSSLPLSTRVGTEGTPWTKSLRGRKIIRTGPQCNLCSRCEQRPEGDGIANPVVLRGTGPGRMLVVTSGQAPYQTQVYKLNRQVRHAGFTGTILFDMAIRCGDPKKPPTDGELLACSPYLAWSVDSFNPDMILLCGNRAARAFTGNSVPVHSNRLCWFGYDVGGGRRIPVVGTHRLSQVDTNEICFQQLLRDISFLLHLSKQREKLALPKAKAVVIHSAADLVLLEDWAETATKISLDVETYGLQHQDDFEVTLVTLTKALDDDTLVFSYDALQIPEVCEWIKRALTLEHVEYGGQGVIYDLICFKVDPKFNFMPGPVKWDTLVDAKLVYAEVTGKLDQLAYWVGIPSPKSEMDAEQKRIKKDVTETVTNDLRGAETSTKLKRIKAYLYKDVEPTVLHRYGARDSWTTLAIHHKLERDLDKFQPIRKHRERLIYDAYGMYARMSVVGVHLSTSNVAHAEDYFRRQLEEHEKVLTRLGISPGKNSSVIEYILDVFPPEAIRYTDKGAVTTTAKTLKMLQSIEGENEVITHLLKWRGVIKKYSSYVLTLPTYRGQDGRVHPIADISGARSGRISMRDPAAQTIPSRGKEAKIVKDFFQADGSTWGGDHWDDDWVIVQADFKTLEIYIAALWSQDPEMLRILRSGIDYHRQTAITIAPAVWGVSIEEADKVIQQQIDETGESPWRNTAKTTNFAIIYQTGPKTLAENTGMSLAAAEDSISAVRSSFSELTRTMTDARDAAQRTGEIWVPWFGEPARRRELPAIGANDWRKGNPERASQNTPIQGWASDICMASAVKIEKEFMAKRLPARLILTVHDSILVECKRRSAQDVREIMERHMTNWPTDPLKLAVDFDIGETWGNLQKFKV